MTSIRWESDGDQGESPVLLHQSLHRESTILDFRDNLNRFSSDNSTKANTGK